MDDNELRALAHRVRDRVENSVDLDAGLESVMSARKGVRNRTRHWVGLAGVAAAVVIVVTAVSVVTRDGGDDVLRSAESTEVEVSVADSSVSTTIAVETEPSSVPPESTDVPAAAPTECDGAPAVGDVGTGGFPTVPEAPNASSLSVSITSEVAGGCPLDEVDVTIDVTNSGTEVVTFVSDLGVLLSAGSANWSVGAPTEMKLAPTESRSQDITITIPVDVAPGTYTLLVAGYEASTPFVVYETATPTDAVDTSSRDLFETVSPTDGAPAALSAIPDGYRPVIANTDVRPAASTFGWSATLVKDASDDVEIKPYLFVQIEDLADANPYEGFPGLADTPEVTLGAFTGRLVDIAPGHPTFVVLLDDSRRLMIGGRADEADLAVLAEGLTVDAEGVVGEIGAEPDGYEIVDVRSMNGSGETTQWAIAYAREQLMASLVTVRATVNPETAAANELLMPTPTEVVDINGYTGYLGEFRVVFDVSPSYQIALTREIAFAGSPLVSDEELLRLARTIAPISQEEFNNVAATAAQNPLTPTDNPCAFYVRASDPVETAEVTQGADGGWTTTTPGTFTVDLSTTQPMGTVTLIIRSLNSSDTTPLVVVEDLDDTATVDVTWDGFIEGQPAPPGDYTVSIKATPADNNTSSCTADGVLSDSTAGTSMAFQTT